MMKVSLLQLQGIILQLSLEKQLSQNLQTRINDPVTKLGHHFLSTFATPNTFYLLCRIRFCIYKLVKIYEHTYIYTHILTPT